MLRAKTATLVLSLFPLGFAFYSYAGLVEPVVWEKQCDRPLAGVVGCYVVQSVAAEGVPSVGATMLFQLRKSGAEVVSQQNTLLMRVAVPDGVPPDRKLLLFTAEEQLGAYNYTRCAPDEGCYVDLEPDGEMLDKIKSSPKVSVHYQPDPQHAEVLEFRVENLSSKLSELALNTRDQVPLSDDPMSMIAQVSYLSRKPNGSCEPTVQHWKLVLGNDDSASRSWDEVESSLELAVSSIDVVKSRASDCDQKRPRIEFAGDWAIDKDQNAKANTEKAIDIFGTDLWQSDVRQTISSSWHVSNIKIVPPKKVKPGDVVSKKQIIKTLAAIGNGQ